MDRCSRRRSARIRKCRSTVLSRASRRTLPKHLLRAPGARAAPRAFPAAIRAIALTIGNRVAVIAAPARDRQSFEGALMQKQAAVGFGSSPLGEAALAASRKVWLAGLGATVV